MKSLCIRGVAAVLLIAATAGCKKEGATDTMELPDELRPHPAQGDPSKIAMPPLLASVPADTPYLLAGLDALPVDYYARLKQAFAPVFEPLVRKWQEAGAGNPAAAAILAELEGKWNQAGLESLGFSSQPRFAIYGLGLQPVVARLALKDHKVFQATIERIAAKAGEALPPMETKDGRSYWKVGKPDKATVVVALADNQLIVAMGTAGEVDAKLDLILGIQKPQQSMADGKRVKELMARHGFGAQLIGFAETRSIATRALEAAGLASSPACTGEIDRLSGKVPRVVFGYGELSATRTSGGFVVELAPDIIPDLRALKTEIPGLAQLMAGHPMMAFGVGIDLARGQKLAIAVADNLKKLGAACEIGPLVAGAEKAAHTLSGPLPEPVGQIAGGAFSVEDLTFGSGRRRSPLPETVEGMALIASPDAKALFDKAITMDPTIKQIGITADGKLHDATGEAAKIPFPLAGGVGDKVIVMTAGTKQRALAEKVIGARGGGKAPLLATTYDFGKFLELEMQLLGRDLNAVDPGFTTMLSSMRNLFGRVSGTIDVTDKGVALWSTMEMK